MNPLVHVGVLSAPEVKCILHGTFQQGDATVTGTQELYCSAGKVLWNGTAYSELSFEPNTPLTDSFELCDVTIGVHFHWERKENQYFRGSLRIVADKGMLVVINKVHIEEYLTSVISSEMSATASTNLLKAHAVISRSWLLAQIENREKKVAPSIEKPTETIDNTEYITWFDREDHTLFDVCADDHCQRYQGITRAYTPQVEVAVRDTCGEVLMYEGKLCDARFSKCCGGAMEQFSTCWEDSDRPYLTGKRDGEGILPDLTIEEEARQWIYSSPEAFCRVNDEHILRQILNNYDRETPDFYRWRVVYSQEELSALIARKLDIDFGTIQALEPLQRGVSGRISRLRITGSRHTMVIGKELLIRSALSESHLYSSAFVVERGVQGEFVFHGAGWGHGVGLCQIGAAVMGEKGYDYKIILQHYYINTNIQRISYNHERK